MTITTETMLSLPQAARRLPPGRGGRPVTLSCVLRWIFDGAPGPTGQRVRLEAVRIGGRWVTSEEALARFAARLTPRLDAPTPASPRSPGRRQRASQRAAAALEKIGI